MQYKRQNSTNIESMKPALPLYSLCLAVLLPAACSEPPASTEVADTITAPVPTEPAATPAETPSLITSLALPPRIPGFASSDDRSVQQLMNEVIEMNARSLWNAVSYTVTAEGTTENIPDTGEEWSTLLQNALALRLGGEALMDQSRPVAPGVDESTWPNWQYTPTEITALRDDSIDEWRLFLVDMQSAVNSIIDTINRQDVPAYTQLGVTLNQACQGCHGSFWYKPQGQ
jgi:hypothetical protein